MGTHHGASMVNNPLSGFAPGDIPPRSWSDGHKIAYCPFLTVVSDKGIHRLVARAKVAATVGVPRLVVNRACRMDRAVAVLGARFPEWWA